MSIILEKFNMFLEKFRKKPSQEIQVLILGLNNSGKSTFAARLANESVEILKLIPPTLTLTEKHLKFNNLRVCIRDLSGLWRMRQAWHTFYQDTKMLIYVVDSTDAHRLAESRCELCDVLQDERMSNVPLLVLASKQDVHGAMPVSIINDMLGLNQLGGRIWSIQGISSLTGEGVDEAIRWIYRNLKKMLPKSRLSKLFSSQFLLGSSNSVNRRQSPINSL